MRHYVVCMVFKTDDKADHLLRRDADRAAISMQEMLWIHWRQLAEARQETFPGLLEDVSVWAEDRNNEIRKREQNDDRIAKNIKARKG